MPGSRPYQALTAEELARALAISRDVVYENARALGGRKLGNGPRGRWRFDLDEALEAWAPRSAGEGSEPPEPAPRRRSSRRSSGTTPFGRPLLPIRGSS